MIARFGSTELSALVNYLGVNSKHHSILKYIRGEQPEWWWNKNIMNQMQQWSGFFPPTPENMQRFGDLMMQDMKELDLLGCWIKNEAYFTKGLEHTQRVHLRLLEPFWANKPWTRCLKNKNIVVVHPFTEYILSQYNNRTLLFSNPDTLPKFASLRTVKAVQSLGGEDNGFKDWFDALKWMEDEIDKEDYDLRCMSDWMWGIRFSFGSPCQTARKKSCSFRRCFATIIRDKRQTMGKSFLWSKRMGHPIWELFIIYE